MTSRQLYSQKDLPELKKLNRQQMLQVLGSFDDRNLSPDEFVWRTVELLDPARVPGLAYLEKEFTRRKLEFVPSCANFILVNVGDGDKVFQALQERGVIVRPMRGYKMPGWVRVTVGLPAENRRFIQALSTVL